MPYQEPVYNLKCDFHKGKGGGGITVGDVGPLIEANIPCNHAWSRRGMVSTTGGTQTVGIPVSLMTLLFPSNFSKPVGPSDGPTGPGFIWVQEPVLCWYWVWMWDWVAAGFGNEHCAALMLKCKPAFVASGDANQLREEERLADQVVMEQLVRQSLAAKRVRR